MNFQKLIHNRELKIIIVDLTMMGLLILNLNLIIVDWIYSWAAVKVFLADHVPAVQQWYEVTIHRNFITIDLWFVGVFLTELLIRWAIAVRKRTHHRWFFYPFIHWYDVLGCIPIGSLRFLRVLRVISIVIRLQKLEVIDITRSYLWASVQKYLNIFVEEVSDRVVVNVIEGVQDEVRRGNPVAERIVGEVLIPHKDSLVEWLANRLQRASREVQTAYGPEIRGYVEKRIADAVERNREISTIAQIPVVGGTVAGLLEHAIAEIVYNVVDGLIEDLASLQNRVVLNDLAVLTMNALVEEEGDAEAAEETSRLDAIAKSILIEALELVKEQVKVQQWKLAELEARAERHAGSR